MGPSLIDAWIDGTAVTAAYDASGVREDIPPPPLPRWAGNLRKRSVKSGYDGVVWRQEPKCVQDKTHTTHNQHPTTPRQRQRKKDGESQGSLASCQIRTQATLVPSRQKLGLAPTGGIGGRRTGVPGNSAP